MNVPKALLDICSNTEIPSAVKYVYADVDQCCVFATNGKIMIKYTIVPDKEGGEVSGYIPPEAIKAAATRKGPDKGSFLHLEKTTVVQGVGTFLNPFSTDTSCPLYPDWNQVFRPVQDSWLSLTFDASFLMALSRVLNPQTNVIRLRYDPANPTKAFHIEGVTDDQGIGLLMPVIVH